MAIENFPAALQPVIQENYLERAFEKPLRALLGYRSIADREDFPNGIGETLTKTRAGLKAAATTPLNPANNTNFDNGLTSSSFGVEQYTLTIDAFGDTIDLNTVTQGVGIADQAVVNARVNGEQAARTLDTLARDALFGGKNVTGVGGYLGGNTRVTATLSEAAASVAVDDLRGFMNVLTANGVLSSVSTTTPMTVIIGSNSYSVVGYTADAVNISTAPNGISGTLNLSGNVTVADGTLNNAVISATAPQVIRPNGRLTTAALVAPSGQYGSTSYDPGDVLFMQNVLAAVATLRNNAVPEIDGAYHCYLDNSQLLGLFRDQDFKLLYQGQYKSESYRAGTVFELLGVRFIPTNLAPQQLLNGVGRVHRALVCGKGALVEGDYTGTREEAIRAAGGYPDDRTISVVDGVTHIIREPLDRLKQIIAQSWYWIGGFALPTDLTANATVIPTATNSYLKRGVIIESLGITP